MFFAPLPQLPDRLAKGRCCRFVAILTGLDILIPIFG